MFFYRVLKYISFVANISMLMVLYYVYRAIKDKLKKPLKEWLNEMGCEFCKTLGKYAQPILIVTSIAGLLTNTTIHELVGVNNLKLKPEGIYCFYVKAMDETGETYIVPAEVEIEKESEDVGDWETRTYTYYYIKTVILSNDTYLYTEDTGNVEINQAVQFCDDDEKLWELVLLNEHAYSPMIQETNNATWIKVSFLIIKTFSNLISIYAVHKCKKKATNEGKEDSCVEDAVL